MRKYVILFLFLNCSLLLCQESKYPAGIIYGPKAAFKIEAPKNWILDNKAGLLYGLHCVLYLGNSTWQKSPVIMYAKIASMEFENVEEFIKFSLNQFSEEDSNFTYERLKLYDINDEYSAIIYDYVGGPYNSYERVAYIQVPKAVCYIVFSSRNDSDFNKYSDALFKTVDTFTYEPEYIKK